MGKLALWIGVAVAVMLLLRLLGPGRRSGADKAGDAGGRGDSARAGSKRAETGDSQPGGSAGELMMGCAVCGVHVPASDAVFARGKVYCGAAHRDEDQARGSKGPT